MKGIVYTMTNTINGKIYVGSTTNLKTRIFYHKKGLVNNNHSNYLIQQDFNNCKKDTSFEKLFIFNIVKEFDEIKPEYLEDEERKILVNIDKNKLYNINIKVNHTREKTKTFKSPLIYKNNRLKPKKSLTSYFLERKEFTEYHIKWVCTTTRIPYKKLLHVIDCLIKSGHLELKTIDGISTYTRLKK